MNAIVGLNLEHFPVIHLEFTGSCPADLQVFTGKYRVFLRKSETAKISLPRPE